MKYFASQSTGGLYLSALHSKIPGDAIEITQEQYDAYKGSSIVWNDRGIPDLYDPARDEEVIRAAITSRRYQAEVAGYRWKDFLIATDRDSQAKLDQADRAVSKGRRQEGEGWKCYDLTLGAELFRPTSNAEISEIADAVYAYVSACFAREAELLEILASDRYTSDQLEQGWPS